MKINRVTILLLIGSMFLLNGCSYIRLDQFIDQVQLQMQPADLPAYIPGEYYTFDETFSMVVAGGDGDKVDWKFNGSKINSGYRDFLIPLAGWENSRLTSVTSSSVTQSSLWPLETGKSAEFQSMQVLTEKDDLSSRTVNRLWKCVVEGTEMVEVPAGGFDTYKVVCDRYSGEDGGWRGKTRYYYSPDLGHYVMVEKSYPGRMTKIQKLTNYGYNSTYLPTKDQKKLRKSLMVALAKNPDGVASSWTSKSKKVSAMLVPYKSFSGQRGQPCREYRSVYNVGGKIRQHTREFCLNDDGQWQRIK